MSDAPGRDPNASVFPSAPRDPSLPRQRGAFATIWVSANFDCCMRTSWLGVTIVPERSPDDCLDLRGAYSSPLLSADLLDVDGNGLRGRKEVMILRGSRHGDQMFALAQPLERAPKTLLVFLI